MCCSCQSPIARRRQCDTLQSVSTSLGQSNLSWSRLSTSTLLHHPLHHDPHSSSTVWLCVCLNSHKLCISQLLDFMLGLCISVMTHHLSLQQSLLSRSAQVFTIFDWASALHCAFHWSVSYQAVYATHQTWAATDVEDDLQTRLSTAENKSVHD